MLRELINETIECSNGDEVADLAAVPRDSKKIVVGAHTKHLDALDQFTCLDHLTAVALNQQQLDSVIATADPRFVVIWDLKASDLSAMSDLQKIERLVINGAQKVENIAPLGQLRNVRLLFFNDTATTEIYTALAALTGLKHLCFAGGHYDSPKRVATLKPLGHLKALRSVNLIGVSASDRSLEPLAKLPELTEISLSNSWPVEEFARLSVLFPDAGCEWFAPYVENTFRGAGFMGLRKETIIYITGARKPSFWNPTPEDWKKIAGYVEAFEGLQEKFRREYGRD
jgi:Leucine-rich repeat (LRR) protein